MMKTLAKSRMSWLKCLGFSCGLIRWYICEVLTGIYQPFYLDSNSMIKPTNLNPTPGQPNQYSYRLNCLHNFDIWLPQRLIWQIHFKPFFASYSQNFITNLSEQQGKVLQKSVSSQMLNENLSKIWKDIKL